ncbi:MAG: lasso RiPP family leader peptide-containing protein [Pseudonocardiaceae bacterium]
MEPAQITEQQTAEQEVYEPPMLAEIGQFTELTSGRGEEVPDASSYMRA